MIGCAAKQAPAVKGEAGTRVTVVWLPGRRAGLEFVEKLLTAMIERNGCSAVQPGAVVPGDVGHGGAAGGRSGGSGPRAPRLSYTAVRRDSPNIEGTIGTFLTYEEAVAAARDYVLRW